MTKKKRMSFAWWISRVFDPIIEIPVMLAVSVYVAVTHEMRWRFLVVLLVTDALLPALYFWVGRIKGFISDWDITKKEERYGLYFFTVMMHLFGVVLAYLLGKHELFKLLSVYWSMAVVFALITARWKISVHAGTNAALLATINFFYGWDRYWWLVIVLLLVMWSRVEQKKHTSMQVLLGAIVSLVWVTVGFQLMWGRLFLGG